MCSLHISWFTCTLSFLHLVSEVFGTAIHPSTFFGIILVCVLFLLYKSAPIGGSESDCSQVVTWEARCAGCLCNSLGWFKCIEPPQTFSNHIIAKISRYVEFLQHEFKVVRLYRTLSNYIFTWEARCVGCLCTSSGWFKHVESL